MTKAGSITRHRSGKWLARATIGGKRVSLGTHETRADAEAVLAAALERAAGVVRPQVTLATYGMVWLARRETDGLHRHVGPDRSRWRTHIATAPFAEKPLRKITRADIRGWLHLLRFTEATQVTRRKSGPTRKGAGRSLSRQSAKHALNLLRSCLEGAVDDGLIPSNPAQGVRVPLVAEDGPGWTYLTAEEIQKVTKDKRIGEASRLLFTVAIYTGLRKGELLGLRWRDVHLGKKPRVDVWRSYDGPPKTPAAIREVPLLPPAIEAFRRIQELSPGVANAYVWRRDDGGCRGRSYDGRWAEWRKVVLSRRVRFHDLRHTCASHLIMGTWGEPLSLYEVCAWLGHSDIKVTQRYAHLAPEALHGRAEKMRREWKGKAE